jgi:heat shock protein HtpX
MNTNTIKTYTLLAALGGFFVLIGRLLGGSGGMVLGLLVGLGIVGASYWFSDKLAIRAAGARPLEPGELPWLEQTVASLSERAGIPMPRVYVSPNVQPNAFATGRNPSHAAVCVTAGLLQALEPDEVAGVIAHELAHVRNRDILIGSVAAGIGQAISLVANMAMWTTMFGGNDDEDRPNPIVLLILSLVAPLAAGIIQMAVSRSREYEADRTGAELLGDPRPLARALRKIDGLARRVPMDIAPAQTNAWIVNPLSGRKVQFANLFMTHPSTEDRVARLLALGSAMAR